MGTDVAATRVPPPRGRFTPPGAPTTPGVKQRWWNLNLIFNQPQDRRIPAN
jgi:hypothetical protein